MGVGNPIRPIDIAKIRLLTDDGDKLQNISERSCAARSLWQEETINNNGKLNSEMKLTMNNSQQQLEESFQFVGEWAHKLLNHLSFRQQLWASSRSGFGGEEVTRKAEL